MPLFQAFFLISTLLILPIAWLKGGHPERRGVTIILVAYVATLFGGDLQIGRVLVVGLVIDVAMLAALIPLGMTSNRWWPLPAVACQLLVVMTFVALIADPEITVRDNVGTRWVFSVVVLYCLLGGVLERWLAGERAVFSLSDRRERRVPNIP